MDDLAKHVGKEMDRLKFEARTLNAVGDWRGLNAILEELHELFILQPETARDFYDELARFDALRRWSFKHFGGLGVKEPAKRKPKR